MSEQGVNTGPKEAHAVKVSVNAEALRRVLQALNGPAHHIRELQAIRNLPGDKNPIDRLIEDFNAAAEALNAGTTEPVAGKEIPDWLEKETFAVQYNPNCPNAYLVRMVGKGRGGIDLLPYASLLEGENLTRDALGFGETIAEAAENAHQEKLAPKSVSPATKKAPK